MPLELNEGSQTVLTFSDPYDPSSSDTAAGFFYAYDCDGDEIFEAENMVEATFTCSYPDNGSFLAGGEIMDKDGGYNEYSTLVTVLNLAPVVGPIIAPIDPVSVGTEIPASANFTDAGVLDTHTSNLGLGRWFHNRWNRD